MAKVELSHLMLSQLVRGLCCLASAKRELGFELELEE